MGLVVRALALSTGLLGPGIGSAGDPPPAVELIETAPAESSLGHADLRDAGAVWIERIGAAQRSIDLGFFYASDREPSRLTDVIEALDAAGHRGVTVRFLLSAGFRATVPATVERLESIPGLELRYLDLEEHGGGVLHAKYFVVDGEYLVIGSQNFDWRALEHIQELGLSVRSPELAAQALAIFDRDWVLSGGTVTPSSRLLSAAPVRFDDGSTIALRASPEHLLPADDRAWWDLPALLELIDGAEERLWVQVMSYRLVGYDRVYWDALDSGLRRAAARGVDVRLTVADWDKRPGRIEAHQSLQPVPNLEVRMVTVPPASEGHIPYARVVHAKYLVADGERAWLGTSNWSRDYFYASRNLGFVIDGGAVPARLADFHQSTWESPYAYPVDPGATYEPPRIGD